MWHELQAVSSDKVRKDVDEGRAPVDFFVSAIVHMALLGGVAVPVGLLTPRKQALVIGLLALATIPFSYRMAVDNVLDWAQSVKAMVNVGRLDLAKALGLQIPATLEDERSMWSAQFHVVELANDAHLASYNSFRAPVETPPDPAPPLRPNQGLVDRQVIPGTPGRLMVTAKGGPGLGLRPL